MYTTNHILYRSDYKYQLAETYLQVIPIRPLVDIETDFINLDTNGKLVIKNGYAWDGPSGPVIDTDENMRASLVHDALYQLLRLGALNPNFRLTADTLFKDICLADGVPIGIAKGYYKVLRRFGEAAASPKNKKVVHRAPEE